MKEKTLNNLKKLFEHIPTILTIGSVFIATASFIFNQFYKKNCEKYYGIILDCFKADMYISRWIALFMVLLLIACSFAIYKIANDKSKPAKVFKILAIITESTILFLINLIAFTVIIESNHKNNLVAKMMMAFNKNMVPFIIILAIISVLSTFLIVLSIQHRKTNEFKLVLAIITSIAFLLQICYFLQF